MKLKDDKRCLILKGNRKVKITSKSIAYTGGGALIVYQCTRLVQTNQVLK